MPKRRRPLRVTVAACVLVAVILCLAVIVVRGPARFFDTRAVQTGATCAMHRNCPGTDESLDAHNGAQDR